MLDRNENYVARLTIPGEGYRYAYASFDELAVRAVDIADSFNDDYGSFIVELDNGYVAVEVYVDGTHRESTVVDSFERAEELLEMGL